MSLPRFHVPRAAPGARWAAEHAAHHARRSCASGRAAGASSTGGREFEAVLDEVCGGPCPPARPRRGAGRVALRLVLACRP
jgi:hypothetical protein